MNLKKNENLSLYFALKKGKQADLEIIAQSAISFVALARVVACEISPTADIKFDLVNASKGSLRLNMVLRWLEDGLAKIDDKTKKYKTLRKVFVGALMPLVLGVSGTVISHFVLPGDGKITLVLGDEEKELIQKIADKDSVKTERKAFYRTLERDPAITNIGITEKRDEIPTCLIPSSRFAELSGLWDLQKDDEKDTRIINQTVDVVLISPVLIKKPRSWRFKILGLSEFSAIMEDKHFLKALEQDHVKENLRTGITMLIQLKIKEQFIDNEWKTKKRSVIKVLSPMID